MRLIDADALKVSITRYCAKHIEHQKWRRLKEHTSELCRDICFAIEAAPTVEERKTGKWICEKWRWIPYISMSFKASYECSVCGEAGFKELLYCPYCGARMNGSKELWERLKGGKDE